MRCQHPKDSFYDGFVTTLFSAHGELEVTQEQRRDALALCQQAGKKAALACMAAFANTDFRDGLAKVAVPALILHGDAGAAVPFEGSGQRTHAAIPGSELHLIAGAPHGGNVSHPGEWNSALLDFLGRQQRGLTVTWPACSGRELPGHRDHGPGRGTGRAFGRDGQGQWPQQIGLRYPEDGDAFALAEGEPRQQRHP